MNSLYDILNEIPGGIPKPTAKMIQVSWPSIVGRDLAVHSEVVEVRAATVTVAAAKPWSQGIVDVRAEIVRRLNRETPWHFKTLLVVERAATLAPSTRPAPKPVVEPSERMENALDTLDDPELAGFASRILKNILEER